MAPLTPSWEQPSHPTIQTVVYPTDPSQFTTKSLSKIDLAPYALFAKMAFPPCTRADTPTYATVQSGKEEHLNLNSDLVYINHSCDPSLVSLSVCLISLGSPGCWLFWRGGCSTSRNGYPPFTKSCHVPLNGAHNSICSSSLTMHNTRNRFSICPPSTLSPEEKASKLARN
jgi:hypothetical protein